MAERDRYLPCQHQGDKKVEMWVRRGGVGEVVGGVGVGEAKRLVQVVGLARVVDL